MAEYVFKVKAQQWLDDPYYVASSAPMHELAVIAETKAGARAEALRVLGKPADYRYWRTWTTQGKDVRLIANVEIRRQD